MDHAFSGYSIILKATVSKMIENPHDPVIEWKIFIKKNKNFAKGSEMKENQPWKVWHAI